MRMLQKKSEPGNEIFQPLKNQIYDIIKLNSCWVNRKDLTPNTLLYFHFFHDHRQLTEDTTEEAFIFIALSKTLVVDRAAEYPHISTKQYLRELSIRYHNSERRGSCWLV